MLSVLLFTSREATIIGPSLESGELGTNLSFGLGTDRDPD